MSQRRLFEMVYLLLEKGQLSASALAERFEVSVRTIYRDVDALSAAGVPIYSTPGRKGGIALMDHYVLNRTAFSEEEQTQILTALKSLSGEAGLWSTETLSKLSALFHRPEPDWLQVDLSHWGNPAQSNAKFKILKEAILSRKEITITYANSSGKTTSRRVYPARLVFKGQTWYLQGLCLKKNDYRTFRISRILHLSSTGRSFNIPLSSKVTVLRLLSSSCAFAFLLLYPIGSTMSLTGKRLASCQMVPWRYPPPSLRIIGFTGTFFPMGNR